MKLFLPHPLQRTAVALFTVGLSLTAISTVHAKDTQLPFPHQHGTADVSFFQNGNVIEFELLFSAQDIVGFESAPTTPKHKKALRDQYKRLINPNHVLQMASNNQGCAPINKNAAVEGDVFSYHSHADDLTSSIFDIFSSKPEPSPQDPSQQDPSQQDPNDVHEVGTNGHSTIESYYHFKCKNDKGFVIDFKPLFNSYKRIKTVVVHKTDWNSVAEKKLTASDSRLKFK